MRTNYRIVSAREYLETEDNAALLDFYARQGFREYDRRVVGEGADSGATLVQMLKIVDLC